jgi:restriction endonuclease Mrr
VWPDEKGTTLRPLKAEPAAPSLNSQESTPAYPDKSRTWNEAEILRCIHKLDWLQFEKFNTVLLRSEGWDATHFRSNYGDGGKDIVAKKNGQALYVQCKALRHPVQEKVVRELLGSLSLVRNASGAIHAAGTFSKSAQAFAAAVGIKLCDDHMLAARALKSISDGQLRNALGDLPHLCPNCGSEMVMRTGDFDPFWGCPRYPKCRGKFIYRNNSE